MKFLALIYDDQTAWQATSEAEREAEIARHIEFSARGREAGTVLGGDELAPTSVATTVRVQEGETLVTDGPYAELKEALGGYYLLECDSIDEACKLAAEIPTAAKGAIEVRPVHTEEQS